jgi:GNAT superfamily N-acetyltransferase
MEPVIRVVKVKDLIPFVMSDEYKRLKVVPISKHRAISHANNPRALPDDTALVLIFFEEQLEAYLGVLPDWIYPNNTQERCGWLSCMWVNPNLRGKGIAKILINKVFDDWQHRILVTEFTPSAKGLYDSTKQFEDLAQPQGLRLFLRFNLTAILTRKFSWASNIKPLLKVTDAALNLLNKLRLQLVRPKSMPDNWSYITQIDNELDTFIQGFQMQGFTRRKASDLQWIQDFPWLFEGDPLGTEAQRYHFSSAVQSFKTLQIKLIDKQNNIRAFFTLSMRDGSMKVPYCFCPPDLIPQVASLINHHAIEHGVYQLSIFHPDLVQYYQRNSQPFFYKRGLQRHYIISKVFQHSHTTLQIQDGDADCAFT